MELRAGELLVPRAGLYYIYAQTYFRLSSAGETEGEAMGDTVEEDGAQLVQYIYKKVWLCSIFSAMFAPGQTLFEEVFFLTLFPPDELLHGAHSAHEVVPERLLASGPGARPLLPAPGRDCLPTACRPPLHHREQRQHHGAGWKSELLRSLPGGLKGKTRLRGQKT